MGIVGIEPTTLSLYSQSELLKEWAYLDSNQGPSPYKGDALTTELYALSCAPIRIGASDERVVVTTILALPKP